MKTLFIDCNQQLGPVFERVHGPGDPAIAVNEAPFVSADLPTLLAGYPICIDDHSYMPTEIVRECRDLRHIVFLGVGAASYMDVPALAALGVTVHTIKGYGDRAVAEHTLALMFAAAREVARMDRTIRGGLWQPLGGIELSGKTLGILGLGGIGREVARMAGALGMKCVAWNRSAVADAPVPMASLDEVLSASDILSVHLSLTDETRGLIDAAKLARLKPGAILVNTARGAIVDEAALIAALESGRLRHAGLDVFTAEPLAADHALARLPNVTLTAHAGFRTPEASETLLRRAIGIVRGIVEAP
jgi:D-3-phosphoglycerate dehydrogenase